MALKGHKYAIDTVGVSKSHKLVIDTAGVAKSQIGTIKVNLFTSHDVFKTISLFTQATQIIFANEIPE